MGIGMQAKDAESDNNAHQNLVYYGGLPEHRRQQVVSKCLI